MSEVLLTTKDNPYDPFSEFDEWYNFDTRKGYDTCGLIARLAKTSEELPDSENSKEIEKAMNSIIEMDPFGLYIKVEK